MLSCDIIKKERMVGKGRRQVVERELLMGYVKNIKLLPFVLPDKTMLAIKGI